MNLRMSVSNSATRKLSLAVLLTAGAVALSAAVCGAATLDTLYSFCGKANCKDGANPLSGLIMDGRGNLYGTAADGGTSNVNGTIFELAYNSETGGWIYLRLHIFCKHDGYACTDGSSPTGRLAIDVNGDLYGTTEEGGDGGGLIFELVPNADRSRWQYKTLYRFCHQTDSCTDGESPSLGLTYQGAASGAPYDGVSPLYGATQFGGVNGSGAVFRLTPVDGKWKEKVIFSFCPEDQCTNNYEPLGGLIMDGNGNLFGATGQAYASAPGTIFELVPGRKDGWRETTLYSFCRQQKCADGNGPGSLMMDGQGNLYGTTEFGGANDWGVVFKLVPNATNSEYSVLYNFCSQANCADGASGSSDLVMDVSGNLYGMTEYGGGHDIDMIGSGGGTVFRLSHSGSLKVLHAFCGKPDCTDGEYPSTGLLLDNSGHLFGTSLIGGENQRIDYGGTIFEITP
jgi:uncharacterized repeat protein (TIGR03803 family)